MFATNSVGSTQSSLIELVVNDPPIITDVTSDNMTGIPGENISFYARGTGSPLPVFQWEVMLPCKIGIRDAYCVLLFTSAKVLNIKYLLF